MRLDSAILRIFAQHFIVGQVRRLTASAVLARKLRGRKLNAGDAKLMFWPAAPKAPLPGTRPGDFAFVKLVRGLAELHLILAKSEPPAWASPVLPLGNH